MKFQANRKNSTFLSSWVLESLSSLMYLYTLCVLCGKIIVKNSASRKTLIMQNEPKRQTSRNRVTSFNLRTKNSEQRTVEDKNKPKTNPNEPNFSPHCSLCNSCYNPEMKKSDKTLQANIAVIGAGPAGLMAALSAAEQTQAAITVVESNTNPARKLLITGGGRCNLTHHCDVRQFLHDCEPYARFLRHAIHTLSPEATCDFFARLGLETVIQPDNCVFPASDRAVDVRDALLNALRRHPNVSFYYDKAIESVLYSPDENTFTLATAAGHFQLAADKLILATGGLSYPKTGSNGTGYALAAALGHTLTEPASCLAPVVCRQPWLAPLAGVSLPDVVLSSGTGKKKTKLQGPLLFTDDGIGGPTAWNFSRMILPQFHQGPVDIAIDLVPAFDAESLQKQIMDMIQASPRKEIARLLTALFPYSVAQCLCRQSGAATDCEAHQLKKDHRSNIITLMKHLPLTAVRLRPIDQAIITRGGIKTSEINPRSMQSNLIENFYFAGEIIDVDGPCGGHNLQIAWSTGFLAGMSAATESILPKN